MQVMWSLDPEIARQLARVREMVTLQQQTPTREWPLFVEESRDELLVVREWPNGSITDPQRSPQNLLSTGSLTVAPASTARLNAWSTFST